MKKLKTKTIFVHRYDAGSRNPTQKLDSICTALAQEHYGIRHQSAQRDESAPTQQTTLRPPSSSTKQSSKKPGDDDDDDKLAVSGALLDEAARRVRGSVQYDTM